MEKEKELRRLVSGLERVVIAFSGGVDSSYLAKVAQEELGAGALCVMGLSPSVSEDQRKRAEAVSTAHRLNLETVATNELAEPGYIENASDRCFYCKNVLYGKLRELASGKGICHVLDGTNADDLSDHRPGRKAAEKYSVLSPLADLGFSKEEIRVRSRALGLETWDKPASPCLASRISYGTPVTIERLRKVENGEAYLRSLGFREFRVRSLEGNARLDFAAEELERALSLEAEGAFRQIVTESRFATVFVNTTPLRSGSMNDSIEFEKDAERTAATRSN